MTEYSKVVLRHCKFCITEKQIFASEDSYFDHMWYHKEEMIKEILFNYRYWCHLCTPPTRCDANYFLRIHLKTQHSIGSITNYYIKQINDGIIR